MYETHNNIYAKVTENVDGCQITKSLTKIGVYNIKTMFQMDNYLDIYYENVYRNV